MSKSLRQRQPRDSRRDPDDALDHLADHLLGGRAHCRWFSWSFGPSVKRGLRDNFSERQPFAEPTEADSDLRTIHVHLSANLSENRDIYKQTARELRRMAAFLLESATEVERYPAETKRRLCEITAECKRSTPAVSGVSPPVA